MPYFSQEPLSYLTLPTIRNAYKTFSIKVTFRPDNVDGEAHTSSALSHFSTLNLDVVSFFFSPPLTVSVVFPHAYCPCVSCPSLPPSLTSLGGKVSFCTPVSPSA